MEETIKLLQFVICKEFRHDKQDHYIAEMVHSNLYVPKFPCSLARTFAVTCWRKDKKFHKEVLEYKMGEGPAVKSPHMDIEPVTSSVLFRWHKHEFPSNLVIDKPGLLTIRVILDWNVYFESYLMIEQAP